MRILNFFWKWCKHFFPLSFPYDCSSLEKLLNWGKHHKIYAFNGQFIRAFILLRLFRYFECSSFIETGTNRGYTTNFVRRVFQTSVFSCEINRINYFISKIFLTPLRRIYLSCKDSPYFLREIYGKSKVGANPMIYLDAHCHKYFPLPQELTIIFRYYSRAIIVIDDFYVPGNLSFGYDEYGRGKRIDIELIRKTVRKEIKKFQVYYPQYDPLKEINSKRRGMSVVVLGQEKELPRVFPFELLIKAEQ